MAWGEQEDRLAGWVNRDLRRYPEQRARLLAEAGQLSRPGADAHYRSWWLRTFGSVPQEGKPQDLAAVFQDDLEKLRLVTQLTLALYPADEGEDDEEV